MLQNGDFEARWESNHRCLRVTPSGAIQEVDIGNIFTPEGWLTWFYHDPDTWDQPEVRDAWKSADPLRVHGGEKATLLFTFFRKHDAGFLQQVPVTPGTKLKLEAYAHAWSNSKDGPHPDDARWSEGAGYNAGFAYEGSIINDDWRNFTFYVGIDPTGGTNPRADTVVWGRGAHIYNAYAQVPPVEATAQGDTVTVFLRSKTLWAFKHNDAYWDAASLKAVGGGEDPVPYKSTVLVLPQEGTRKQLDEVLDEAYPDRRTFCFSNDDAGGIADLTDGVVILYNIPEDRKEDFIDFYAARYPGANLAWAYTSDWQEETVWHTYLLYQCDPAWADVIMSGSSCYSSICSQGCYITCIAMTQRVYGMDPDATPATVSDALGPDGWYGCEARWAAIEENCGIKIKSTGDLNAHLAEGGVAMGEVRMPSQHFVLIVEKQGDDYLVLDPWRNEVCLLSKYYNELVSYRILTKTAPPAPPRETIGHIGLHQQTIRPGAQQFHTLPPGITKVFTHQDLIGMIRWTEGKTPVVFRHYDNDQGKYLENVNGPEAGARLWLSQFESSLRTTLDQVYAEFPNISPRNIIIEYLNETYPSCNEFAVTRARDADAAWIKVLAESGLRCVAGVFCAAVGNPHESEFDLLVPLARLAQNHGAWFGYHDYFLVHPEYGGPDHLWQYLAGRWVEMDRHFTSHGIHVHWFGGEGGAVGGASGAEARAAVQAFPRERILHRARFRDGDLPYGISMPIQAYAEAQWVSLYPCDGWKSDKCYNGDWARYLVDLARKDELTMEWNKYHDDRNAGSVVFTTGESWTGWDSFQFQEPEMVGTEAMLRQRYAS